MALVARSSQLHHNWLLQSEEVILTELESKFSFA